ncbi:MAG: putative selenium-dependent hydroxylase accessory protein YqeC [Eubacteriales bacterium]|nr:putative selenium-dependent hydroxylase accessory protein YqeC [Eubacteriales bacterium]
MRLSDALHLPRGVIAAVGGGGKTTLLWQLALETSETNRVLLTTTTHIWPPCCTSLLSPTRAEIRAAFETTRLLAVGERTDEGKLGPAGMLNGEYEGLADYVFIEADGARGLPLKAPAGHEPVLPKNPALILAVAGMSCVGRSIRDAAHRPERYAELAGLGIDETITPQAVARVLTHPQGQHKGVTERFAVVLNQADDEQRLAFAREVAKQIAGETLILALQTQPGWMERWRDGRREE